MGRIALIAALTASALTGCADPQARATERARLVADIFPDLTERGGIHLAQRAGPRALRVAWDTARVTRPEIEWRVSGSCIRLDPAHDGRTSGQHDAATRPTRMSDGRLVQMRDETFTCLRG